MNCFLRQIQLRIYKAEESGLAELYRLFNKKLFHFSKAITRSIEESEEIVEDVFVRLWCNRYNIMQIENLRVYLYVAVKNRSLNVATRKTQELMNISFDELDVEAREITMDPCQIMISAERVKKVEAAIASLPPRCKLIFKLVREDGLKYKEVAEILDISVNTIDVQIAIALKKISAALRNDDFFKGFASRPGMTKGRN